MAKKILIVGGTGFVGGNIAVLARKKWQVYAFTRRSHLKLDGLDIRSIDITRREELMRAMDQIKPEAVVNAAAVSNIDFAEIDRERTRQVNVAGAQNIAEACRDLNARYVFFSSDAVFSGSADIYYEQDPPDPVNFYGRTKAEAEQAVLSIHPDTAVIRISLVMGYPVAGGNAFFIPLEKSLGEGEELLFPTYEYRTPVDVLTLAESVLELAENDFQGILHIGATNSINRYDLARQVAAEMGYDPDLVKPKESSAPVPGRAPRHRNGIICVNKAQKLLRTRMLTVEQGVRRAVKERL